mmetsp:Transcript_25420/g.36929  ORF Transcript_25420/g.36929 Transcript_25420/m.36929 type:complete len:453 (+) Transcript_25420:65-1423(+)
MNNKSSLISQLAAATASASAERSAAGRFRLNEPMPPSLRSTEKATIASQVATAAAARGEITTDIIAHRRRTAALALASEIRANDPKLTSLKLYRRPGYGFNDTFSNLLQALAQNRTIQSVEMSWIFLASLTEAQRIILMTHLGRLPALTKLQMEGIGPASALVAALRGCRTNLQNLRVGSLRISSEQDVKEVADALSQLQSLQNVLLSNIRIKTNMRYRIDHADGSVHIEGIDDDHDDTASTEQPQQPRRLVAMDPILEALAGIPTLSKIALQLQLDSSKVTRLTDKTIQSLCEVPSRKYLMLHSCNLDDEHCNAISKALQDNKNTSMYSLSLAENEDISANGWCALATMLEKNYSLEYLHTDASERSYHSLPTSFPSIHCRAKMDHYLKLNRAGRGKLLLADHNNDDGGDGEENDTHKGWIELLIKDKEDLNVVFYVFQTNPPLCKHVELV